MCIFIAGKPSVPTVQAILPQNRSRCLQLCFQLAWSTFHKLCLLFHCLVSVYKICLKQALSSRAVIIPDSLYFPIAKKEIIKSLCKYFISYFSGITGKYKVTMIFESLVVFFSFEEKFLSSKENYITAYTYRKKKKACVVVSLHIPKLLLSHYIR